MSLQWTIMAGVLYIEVAIVLLFILPFVSPKRWQRIFKSKMLHAMAPQAMWYFAVVIIILALLLVDSIREMRKYSSKEAHYEHKQLESELQISMRLFRAQRNFYISSFALFLSLVIRRMAGLISNLATAQAENEAILKQANSATTAARGLLASQGAGEAAQNVSNEAHQKEMTKLKEEITKLKEGLSKAERDKLAVIEQAEGVKREYDRLAEEHARLQKKATTSGSDKKDD